MRQIDYSILVENCEDIINTLEHDSMRSAGKMKMNAETISSLYELLPIYKDKVVKVKPTPKKKEG
jgi:hypothetical protein